MNFFILGLPRSRTAWLANFLSYENKFCYHEAVEGCKTLQEYQTKLGQNFGDSSTMLHLLEIEKNYPNAKKLIITQNVNQSYRSIKKIFPQITLQQIQQIDHAKNQIKGWHLPYAEINNNLEKIWEYFHNTPVNKTRLNELIKTQVQILDPVNIDVQSLQILLKNINYRPS